MKATSQGKLDQLALAIARGSTIRAAAKLVGMSEVVARQKVRERSFKVQVDELRADILRRAVGMLARATTKAVRTLYALLDEREAPTTRLGAARAILASVIEVQAHADFGTRLADVEAKLAARESRGPVKVLRNGNGG